MSGRRRTAWILAVAGAFAAATAVSAHEKLAILGVERDDVDGVGGLATVVSVEVSADGQNVYGSSAGEGAVQVFRRHSDGELEPIQVVRNGENGVSQMWGPFFFKLSPDGKNLYVPTRSDNSLVVLNRDPATGLLTFLESHLDGIAGVDGLNDSMAAEVSAPQGCQPHLMERPLFCGCSKLRHLAKFT